MLDSCPPPLLQLGEACDTLAGKYKTRRLEAAREEEAMSLPNERTPQNDGRKSGPRRFLEVLQQEGAALLQLNLVFLLSCVPLATIPPACLALHRILRRMEAGEGVHCWRDYWDAFRTAWRDGFAALLLTALPLAAAGYGMWFYLRFAASNPLFYLPFMLCSTVFLVTLLASTYLYGLLADGRALTRGALRLALVLGLGKPLRAVLAALLWYGPLLAALLWFPLSGAYLLLIGCSIPCLMGRLALAPVLESYGGAA